jgi:hypothetical protein
VAPQGAAEAVAGAEPEEVKRVLARATSLKARAMLTLSYGCGLRAGDIGSAQMIIGVMQSKAAEILR